ncbi:hypothetical protein Sm713_10300 [Streptomyces sp. TS71-3]|nr:hypothetical protein Sm713_10300 [Streptomyces sp. TS71-3]
MKIGYSFWGFLGNGVTDTPDGGRSHRRPLIDELQNRGHKIVFLQENRDLKEAGDDLGGAYTFDDGFPDLDVLFLEWRWPIRRRNTTTCGAPGHTCDLHRQAELLHHYTHRTSTPTVIWDKDRRLPANGPWRRRSHVVVCEAALTPSPDAHRLLFPAADELLDSADPHALAKRPRPTPLAYVGNQYDRDEEFDRYLAPAAAQFDHVIAGKWNETSRWPQVTFSGRVPFQEVARIHGSALATVLLLPARYAAVGQMTQRITEAVLAGCLPLAPVTIQCAETFVPKALMIKDGNDAIRKIAHLQEIAGTQRHADLIRLCLDRLELFRLSRQADTLDTLLTALVTGEQPGRRTGW